MARPIHRLSLLLIVAFGISLLPIRLAMAQSSGLPDMKWASPTWGYTIRWFSNEWTVVEESSSEEGDVLALTDTLGNYVGFLAATDFGGDAETCLNWILADTEALPEITDFRLAQDAQGAPYVFRSATQAYAAFSMTRLGTDGVSRDLAGYIECQTLVPGEAVLERVYAGPPEVFAQWYDDLVVALESVFLPASAWLADDPADAGLVWAGIAPLAGRDRINAALVLDEQEQPRLLVGLEAEGGANRMVTFENVSDAPQRVAPSGVRLTLLAVTGEAAERSWPITAMRWEDGLASESDGSRVLAPGERATALLDFAAGDLAGITCDDLPLLLLTYQPPEERLASGGGTSVEFAESALPDALGDCLSWELGPAMGPPVFAPDATLQPPGTSGLTRETLLAEMDGALDELGRIPLVRLAMPPGASFTDLPRGAQVMYVEWGAVDVLLDNVTLPAQKGEQISADTGEGLIVRTGDDGGATLLLLLLAPPPAWSESLVGDPLEWMDVELLFPEQDLLARSAAHRFTVERVSLSLGASLTLGNGEEPAPAFAAVLVESGSVTVRDPADSVGFGQSLVAGESRRMPAGTSIAATTDQEARLLLVTALPAPAANETAPAETS